MKNDRGGEVCQFKILELVSNFSNNRPLAGSHQVEQRHGLFTTPIIAMEPEEL
jgi:hypothetical protein